MIKKISQLNRLPEEFYIDIDGESDEEVKLRQKRDESLFEVSYETHEPINQTNADEINYYTSYSITLSGLGGMLEVDKIKELLSTIISGGLSVISGDLTIGTPNDTLSDCFDGHDDVPNEGHKVSTDTDHHLLIYSETNINNDLTVHGNLIGHTSLNMLSGTVLSCQGRAIFDKLIEGTAYRARWADLAEIYSADAQYEPGTLVKFGGNKEITIATDKANAVVTTNPGFILNGEDKDIEHPTGIALVGRVPIRIRGPVHKFDKIVLSRTDPGIGVVYNFANFIDVVARALEENLDSGEKLVLCVTDLRIY